jgi:hypothetical protein
MALVDQVRDAQLLSDIDPEVFCPCQHVRDLAPDWSPSMVNSCSGPAVDDDAEPCTWETTVAACQNQGWRIDDCPNVGICASTPCVDWLDGFGSSGHCPDCMGLGANDLYCIGSFVNDATADGWCTYEMFTDYVMTGPSSQVAACDMTDYGLGYGMGRRRP